MKYKKRIARLARKIQQYEKMMTKNPRYERAFKRPGSLKKV